MSQINSVPVGAWTSYTLTVGAVTTAPTFTSNVFANKAVYRVIGKSLQIMYTFSTNDSVGAVAGSGVYLFPIPAGFTIDTTLIQGSGYPGMGVCGPAAVNDAANRIGYVCVWNSTNLALLSTSSGTPVGSGVSGATTTPTYSFLATVPIV